MSANLVPPKVIVNTPRPQHEDEKETNAEFNGVISITLSNFVNRPKSPVPNGGIIKKRSPRSSPCHSPRPQRSPRTPKKEIK
ncbi:hypothetical protein WR25_11146 [Diploscapter pachys]|uniref:Uncharacterized protein n=1 Tax=Diploscapter pachys TaxID=2018661 RepID=A0A2A2JJ76_9BILA|nr:hypothetical protein WR25_11146 [Diploscapter pachys]